MKVWGMLVALASVCVLCLASAPAGAVEINDRLSLNGYGNWSYGKTDGNAYAAGTDEGTWDKMEFSLGVTALPSPNVAVHAQAFWEIGEGETESSMDFAFVEYAFSPALALRAGRVKQPFGIYTEIFDVGVLAPFTFLPQGIYGPSGFVAEAYMGAGATGTFDLSDSLHLQYDLYGGEVEAALTAPWAEADAAPEGEGAAEAEESTDIQDMVGARLQVGTADGTYTVGVSGYTGQVDTKTFGEEAEGDRHSAVGAHAEVMLTALTVRAEYAYEKAETFTANAAYAEASYLLTPRWRLALRYDWTKVDPDESDDVDDSLLESTDIGLAVNYVVSPNFVVKLAYHMVDGNRFAATDDEAESADEKTGLVEAGVSFAF